MAWTKRHAADMFQRMVEERHRDMGRTIARLREAKGWTQPDLAHEAGVSIGTISRLENGKHEGRGGTVRAVAKALEVKVQEILPAADADEGDMSQLDRIESRLAKIEAVLSAIATATDAPKGKKAANVNDMVAGIWGELADQPAPMRS